jgi:eukaryotic-like serine/threonine-protein kinase
VTALTPTRAYGQQTAQAQTLIWSSGFSDPQWISVDLGAVRRISEIRLSWERAYATAYRVQVSADGRSWTSVYRTTRGTGGEITIRAGKVTGRYVRVYGTKRSGQYGYSLFEIDVR